MNRKMYFDYIEEKLNILAYRIETRGKLNILDLHLHSENFYLHLFNLLYNYNLQNLNTRLQNVAAIDLIDHQKRVIIQVSATCTKGKIESALEKVNIKAYNSYGFIFISISKDASNLRGMSFKNPHSINFNPSSDIYDIPSVLTYINSFNIDDLKSVYTFIKKELSEDVDIQKLDSNLASVINILSKESWDDANRSTNVNSFEIDRKIDFNDLVKTKEIIQEYCVFYKKVDEKYTEFDESGVNKSNSVLATIRREYLKNSTLDDADDIFQKVIDGVKEKVIGSANFPQIPIDELELCVDILVVDAFTRCKIFKNPVGYNHVAT